MIGSPIQFVFVLETDNVARTDEPYITYLVKNLFGTYFEQSGEYAYKRSYVFMGGKRNYNKQTVINEIKTLINEFNPYKTIVVYIIDTDNESNTNIDLNNNILAYCVENKYFLIYFSHKIENIFFPNEKKIDKLSLKKKFAKGNPKIKTIIKNLNERKYFVYKFGKSNFIHILDKIISEETNIK